MKKIFNIITIGALAAIAAVSCTRENFEADKATKTTSMSILACDENDSDSKTVLNFGKDGLGKVNFTSEDRLFVYGINGETIQGTQFKPAEGSKGRKDEYTFTTDSWPEGYSPIYAVSTTNKDATKQSCTSDGKVTMLVNNETQKFEWSASYAVNTAGHFGKVEDGTVKLKNVCGLIQFRVQNDDITKIVVTGNGGEALGGWITADYAQLSDSIGFYTAGAETFKSLELTVASYLDKDPTKVTNGCFPTDTTFLISLLPGKYSSGLTLTMYNNKGQLAKQEIKNALPIKRSQIRRFNNPIDNGLTFKDPEMPDTLTFVLVKSGQEWPFDEAITAKASQTSTGETYNYTYLDAKSVYKCKFPFIICNSVGTEDKGYVWTPSFPTLDFTNDGDWIKLPAIKGRRVVSISLKVRNKAGKSMSIGTTAGGTDIVSQRTITSTEDNIFPIDGADSTSYFINAKQSSCFINLITVVYAKVTLPETVVLDCTDASNFRYDNGGTISVLPARASKPESPIDFWLNGRHQYKFNGKVGDWNKTLNSAANDPVKLPAIDGYKLSKVNVSFSNASANREYNLTDGTNTLGTITVKKEEGAGDMTIDESKATSTDRYLVSTGEMCCKFTLTYKLIK